MKIDLSVLSKKDKTLPLYVQLKDLLRGAILSGVYLPGEKLESERELIKSGNLSYPTVSNALKELANEGWVIRKVGSGTFVSEGYLKNTRRLKKIAVLYYSTETPFFQKTFDGIYRECVKHNIEAVPVATGLDKIDTPKIMNNIKAQNIDGILGLPFGSIELASLFTKMFQNKFPIVITGTYFHLLHCDSVALNNEKGAYEITKHLLTLGHKKIAFLGSITRYPFDMVHIDAINGINHALEEESSGIKINPVLFPVGVDVNNHKFISDITSLFASIKEAPTAIICEGEGLAKSVYKILKNIGFDIPLDVSVTSFGNFTNSLEMDPPLTTVDWPLQRVGAEAVKLIASRGTFPDQSPVRVVIDTSLIVRQSTASPK